MIARESHECRETADLHHHARSMPLRCVTKGGADNGLDGLRHSFTFLRALVVVEPRARNSSLST